MRTLRQLVKKLWEDGGFGSTQSEVLDPPGSIFVRSNYQRLSFPASALVVVPQSPSALMVAPGVALLHLVTSVFCRNTRLSEKMAGRPISAFPLQPLRSNTGMKSNAKSLAFNVCFIKCV